MIALLYLTNRKECVNADSHNCYMWQRTAFDASMFPFIQPENLKELMQKDAFETMFCLHEVGQLLDVS